MSNFQELVKNLYTSKNRELTEEKLQYIEKNYKDKEQDFVKNFYTTIGEELTEEKFNYINDKYLKKKENTNSQSSVGSSVSPKSNQASPQANTSQNKTVVPQSNASRYAVDPSEIPSADEIKQSQAKRKEQDAKQASTSPLIEGMKQFSQEATPIQSEPKRIANPVGTGVLKQKPSDYLLIDPQTQKVLNTISQAQKINQEFRQRSNDYELKQYAVKDKDDEIRSLEKTIEINKGSYLPGSNGGMNYSGIEKDLQRLEALKKEREGLAKIADKSLENVKPEIESISKSAIKENLSNFTTKGKSSKGEITVPNQQAIIEYADKEAEKRGLEKGGYYSRLIQNQLSGEVAFKIIEPKVNQEFETIFEKRNGAKINEYKTVPQKSQEILIKNGEQLKAQHELSKDKVLSSIKSEYQPEYSAVENQYKTNIDTIKIAQESDVELQTLLQQQSEQLGVKYQQEVNSGKLSVEEATRLYNEEYNQIATKTYNDKYLPLFGEAYNEYLNQFNGINKKLNQRAEREISELNRVFGDKLKSIDNELKSIPNKDPEFDTKVQLAYKEAYNKVLKENHQELNQGEQGWGAFGAGWRSFKSSLGSSLKDISSALGFRDLEAYWASMETENVSIPEPIKQASDLLDLSKVLKGTGQLGGTMLPTMLPAVAVTLATGGTATGALLGAGVSFMSETIMMSESVKQDVFAETGSVAKAEQASTEMVKSQLENMWTYSLDMLPFTNWLSKPLRGINKAVSIPLRFGINAGIEVGTETIQEFKQGSAEQSILKYGVRDFASEFETPQALKETFFTVTPTALFGGLGQIKSISNELITERKVGNNMATIRANAIIAQNMGANGMNQYVSNMVNEQGADYTSVAIQNMYKEGLISKEILDQSLQTIDRTEKSISTATSLGLDKGQAKVFNAITEDINSARQELANAYSQFAKNILEDRIKQLEREASTFANTGKTERAVLTLQNGQQYIATAENLANMLHNEEFAQSVENGDVQVNMDGAERMGMYDIYLNSIGTPKLESVADKIRNNETLAPSEKIIYDRNKSEIDRYNKNMGSESKSETVVSKPKEPKQEVTETVKEETEVIPIEESSPLSEYNGKTVSYNGEIGVLSIDDGGKVTIETDSKIYELDADSNTLSSEFGIQEAEETESASEPSLIEGISEEELSNADTNPEEVIERLELSDVDLKRINYELNQNMNDTVSDALDKLYDGKPLTEQEALQSELYIQDAVERLDNLATQRPELAEKINEVKEGLFKISDLLDKKKTDRNGKPKQKAEPISKAEEKVASETTSTKPIETKSEAKVEPKKEAPKEKVIDETKQKEDDKHNKLVNLRSAYNGLSPARKNRKEGSDLLTRINKLANELGYTVSLEKGKISITNNKGKSIGKRSQKVDEPKPSQEAINHAIDHINRLGILEWNGDGRSARVDLGISWSDIRKGKADIEAGKTDTLSARRLINAIYKQKDEGGYTFIIGGGSLAVKVFSPIDESVADTLGYTQEELTVIEEQQEQLAKEFDSLLENMTEEEFNNFLNIEYDTTEQTETESDRETESDVNAETERATPEESGRNTKEKPKEITKPKNKQELADKIRDVFGLSKKKSQAVADIIGLSAKSLVKAGVFNSEKEFWDSLPEFSKEKPDNISDDQYQSAKGVYSSIKNMIYNLTGGDVSTVLHEVSHWWLDNIDRSANKGNKQAKAMQLTLDNFAKSAEGIRFWKANFGGKFDAKNYKYRQELFARSYERYLYDGVAPTPKLKQIFDDISQWFKEIYASLADIDINLSDGMRSLYGKILSYDEVQLVEDDFVQQSESEIRENLSESIKSLDALNEELSDFDAFDLFQKNNIKNEIIGLNLEVLDKISEAYEKGDAVFKRLSQREQYGFAKTGKIGIESAVYLDRLYGANQEGNPNEQGQKEALKQYAKKKDIWIADVEKEFGKSHTEGQEALVWFNESDKTVTKAVVPYVQTPQEYLDRIAIHNSLFPETNIKVEGYSETKDGDIQFIINQPLVIFDRGATIEEVKELMSNMGYKHMEDNDFYNNDTLIEDLHKGNAVVTNNGKIAIIDPIIRFNTAESGYGGDREVGSHINDDILFQNNSEIEQIKQKAISDGTFMKAPNGKPTNLNERQWLQVRSSDFRSWFGDWQNDPQNASKVVDENGEPMVVYHGTSKYGFTEFKPNPYISNLIFFSEERKGAEPFTYGGALGSGVYEVFLNVRNPLNPKNVYKSTEEKSVAKRAIKNNKDGFKVADFSIYSGFAETNWAIFNPNQIKSATDNVGTFDNTNPNILFQARQNERQQAVDNIQKWADVAKGKNPNIKKSEFIEILKNNSTTKKIFDYFTEKEVGDIFANTEVDTSLFDEVVNNSQENVTNGTSERRYISRVVQDAESLGFQEYMDEVEKLEGKADRISQEAVEKIAEKLFQSMLNADNIDVAFLAFLNYASTRVFSAKEGSILPTMSAQVFHKIIAYYKQNGDIKNAKRWIELFSGSGRALGQFISAMQESSTPEAIANKITDKIAEENNKALDKVQYGGKTGKEIMESTAETLKTTKEESKNLVDNGKKTNEAKNKAVSKSKPSKKAIKDSELSDTQKKSKESAKAKAKSFFEIAKGEGLFQISGKLKDIAKGMVDDILDMGAKSKEIAFATYSSIMEEQGVPSEIISESFNEVWSADQDTKVKDNMSDYIAEKVISGSKTKPKKVTEKTNPLDMVANVLIARATEIIPESARQTAKKTIPAIERLAELIKNKEIAESAWRKAMNEVRNQIEVNPMLTDMEKAEMIAQLEDDISNFMSKPLPKSLVRKAVKTGAKDLGVEINKVIQESLESQTDTGNTIAKNLIEQLGLDADTAQELQDAVMEDWNDMLSEAKERALEIQLEKDLKKKVRDADLAKKRAERQAELDRKRAEREKEKAELKAERERLREIERQNKINEKERKKAEERIKKLVGLINNPKPNTSKGKDLIDNIMEAVNGGVLDDAVLKQAFENQFGLRTLTPEQETKLRNFVKLLSTDLGIEYKGRIARDFADFLKSLEPRTAVAVYEFAEGAIVSMSLSGLVTNTLNIPVGTASMMSKSYVAKLATSPIGMWNAIQDFAKTNQSGIGRSASKSALKTGYNQLADINEVFSNEPRIKGSLNRYIFNNIGERKQKLDDRLDKSAQKKNAIARALFMAGNFYYEANITALSLFQAVINLNSAFDPLLANRLGEYYNYVNLYNLEVEKNKQNKLNKTRGEILDSVREKMGYNQIQQDIYTQKAQDIARILSSYGIELSDADIQRESKWQMLASREQEVVEQAYEEVSNASMMGKPYGVFGKMLESTQRLTQYNRDPESKLDYIANAFKFAARVNLMLFSRVATMSLNTAIKAIPLLGALNSFYTYKPNKNGKWDFQLNSKEEIRRNLIGDAAILATYVGLLAHMFDWDDEEETFVLNPNRLIDMTLDVGAITKDYKRGDLEEDYTPLAIRVRTSPNKEFKRWQGVKYGLPIIPIVAMLGGLSDRINYKTSTEDYKEEQGDDLTKPSIKKKIAKKDLLINAYPDVARALGQLSFNQTLRTIGDIFTAINPSTSADTRERKFTDIVANTSKPYKQLVVPFTSNISRDIINITASYLDVEQPKYTKVEKIFLNGFALADFVTSASRSENRVLRDRFGNKLPRQTFMHQLTYAVNTLPFIDIENEGIADLQKKTIYQIINSKEHEGMAVPKEISISSTNFGKILKNRDTPENLKIQVLNEMSKEWGRRIEEKLGDGKWKDMTEDEIYAIMYRERTKAREYIEKVGYETINGKSVKIHKNLYKINPKLYLEIFPEYSNK